MPRKQPKRSRLWLNDGSGVRLRPQRRNHVMGLRLRISRGRMRRSVRLHTVIDEYTRECLAIIGGEEHQVCGHYRDAGRVSEKGSTRTHPLGQRIRMFTASAVRAWLGRVGARPSKPGSPWEPMRASTSSYELLTGRSSTPEGGTGADGEYKRPTTASGRTALGYRPQGKPNG